MSGTVSFIMGPWFVNEATSSKYMSSVEHEYANGQRGTIALVGAPDLDTQNANALLIGAAPDLFQQLKLALAVIDRAGIVWMGEQAAQAVLAKARGES